MPDFSLLGNAPNAGQAFMQGFQGARETIRKESARNALSAYAQNPNDPQAMNALAQYDAPVAIELRQKQQEYQLKQAESQQKLAEQGMKTAGQLALQVAGLPEQQRPQAWDAAIDQLAPSFPGAAQFKGKYSPDTLRYVLAQAGMGDTFASLNKERYISGGEGSIYQLPGYGETGGVTRAGETPPTQSSPQTEDPAQIERFIASLRPELRDAARRELSGGAQMPQGSPLSPTNNPTPPKGGNRETLLREAREAIARGADPTAVKARLRQMGVQ